VETRVQQLALIHLANEVTAVSSYVANLVNGAIWTTEKLGEPEHGWYRAHVIPNGVDTELFHPGRADTEANRIFFVGRSVGRKNFDLVRKLGEKIPDTEFRVRLSDINDSERKRLNNSVDNLTALPRLTTKEMAAEYAAATATLAPYKREGFGMALIESLAAGTPAIGYNDGNISNLFSHTKAGILCETLSISEWQSALECVEPDALTAEARKAARRFEWGRIVSMYHTIYDKALETGRHDTE
jgi:glycosyltransferase involved in cell wall biosynthesis